MGQGPRHRSAGRDEVRLLGARYRAHRRRRSRQRTLLVSPRWPAVSQGPRRRPGGRRAHSRDKRRAVSAPLVLPSTGIVPELAVRAMPDDERVWVPQAQDVWFRPLLLNTVTGGWCNLLRVRRSGVLSRHRHPMIVVGYVIRGKWRYLEHDWVASEGSFVF